MSDNENPDTGTPARQPTSRTRSSAAPMVEGVPVMRTSPAPAGIANDRRLPRLPRTNVVQHRVAALSFIGRHPELDDVASGRGLRSLC